MLRLMRTPAYFALATLLSLGLPAAHGTPAKPVPGKASPKTKTEATKAPDAKEVTLPGIVTKRPNGGFVSIDVVGTNFVLRFYDKDKKQIAPDAKRASVRWQPKQKPRQMTSILLPSSDGRSLKGDKVVQPPFVFKVYVTLYSEGETVLENFQADYRDDGIPPEGN